MASAACTAFCDVQKCVKTTDGICTITKICKIPENKLVDYSEVDKCVGNCNSSTDVGKVNKFEGMKFECCCTCDCPSTFTNNGNGTCTIIKKCKVPPPPKSIECSCFCNCELSSWVREEKSLVGNES